MRTIFALLALLSCAAQFAVAADVAIIVNKANKVETLSAKELKQIFSGDKARWPDGGKIQPLVTGAASPDHRPAIQFLFGMSEAEYTKYCLHANFVGTPQAVPRDAGSSQAMVNLVKLIPGSIGFVRADLVDPSVKVVKIDGRAPGDGGYPMAGAK